MTVSGASLGIGLFIARFCEALTAVIAIDVNAAFEPQVDQGMAEGIRAALTADVRCVIVDDLDFPGFRTHPMRA